MEVDDIEVDVGKEEKEKEVGSDEGEEEEEEEIFETEEEVQRAALRAEIEKLVAHAQHALRCRRDKIDRLMEHDLRFALTVCASKHGHECAKTLLCLRRMRAWVRACSFGTMKNFVTDPQCTRIFIVPDKHDELKVTSQARALTSSGGALPCARVVCVRMCTPLSHTVHDTRTRGSRRTTRARAHRHSARNAQRRQSTLHAMQYSARQRTAALHACTHAPGCTCGQNPEMPKKKFVAILKLAHPVWACEKTCV